MEKKQIEKYIGKSNLTFFLRNSQIFTYSRIQELSDSSVVIYDKFGSLVTIDLRDISWVREPSSNNGGGVGGKNGNNHY